MLMCVHVCEIVESVCCVREAAFALIRITVTNYMSMPRPFPTLTRTGHIRGLVEVCEDKRMMEDFLCLKSCKGVYDTVCGGI